MGKSKYMDRTQLTPREAEVLELQAQGLSYVQIAEKLHITAGMVSNKLRSIRIRQRAKEQQS